MKVPISPYASYVCYFARPDPYVQKWEIGDKKPSGPALKLLNIVERKGLKALA